MTSNKNNAANSGSSPFLKSVFNKLRGRRRPLSETKNGADTSKRREKKPLQREIPPADAFPIDALGPVLGGAARALQNGIQAPMALCGNTVLAVAHLAAQAHADVLVDGRVTPLSGFFLTVAGSGERKSAVDSVALKEIREFEKRLQEAYSLATRVRGSDRDNDLKSRKSVGTAANASAEGSDRTKELASATSELPPLSPIIICEEPTFEGLVKNLAVGYPSQGLFSDEGGRFLSGYSMGSENITATLAGLCKLWDGKALDRVRAGDGALKLYGRRLSFHLMAQPDVASTLMGNSKAEDQGFLSRCLVTMPPSTIGSRMYRPVDLKTSPELGRFHSCILGLLQRAPKVEDATDLFRRAQLSPKSLTLNDGAKAVYVDFHNYVENAMVDKLRELRGFANKAPEHLLRLAGTLCIIENIDALEISQAHAECARALVEFYLGEARRVNEMAKQDPDLRTAQKLLDWIQEKARAVSLVEIYTNGPQPVRNVKRARHFTRILFEHGYLNPVKNVEFRGVQRDEGWEIAP